MTVQRFGETGADLWQGGSILVRRDGKYTTDRIAGHHYRRSTYACRHVGLKGDQRCAGCGRTINEIELDK